MSLHTPGLPQHQTTKSKQNTDGWTSDTVPRTTSELLRPEMVGKKFLSVIIYSPVVIKVAHGNHAKYSYHCRCELCNKEYIFAWQEITNPRWLGCQNCKDTFRSPMWLVRRCENMRARCENQSHKAYQNYGGRGIKFNFDSPRDAANWIVKNLGLVPQDNNIQLDRINNDGNYEPGNLRCATKQTQNCNTRRGGWVASMHKFKLLYPNIRYSDKTFRNLLSVGLTFDQIIERYNRKSLKPKGVYGTFSIADLEIASLAKDC